MKTRKTEYLPATAVSVAVKDRHFHFRHNGTSADLKDWVKSDATDRIQIAVVGTEDWEPEARITLSVRAIAMMLFQCLINDPKGMALALQQHRDDLTTGLTDGLKNALSCSDSWADSWSYETGLADLEIAIAQPEYARFFQTCALLSANKVRWRKNANGIVIEERIVREHFSLFEDFRREYHEDEEIGPHEDDHDLWLEALEEDAWPISYGIVDVKLSFGALVGIVLFASRLNFSELYPTIVQNWVDVFSVLAPILSRIPKEGSLPSVAQMMKEFGPIVLRQKCNGWPGTKQDRRQFRSKLPKTYRGFPLAF